MLLSHHDFFPGDPITTIRPMIYALHTRFKRLRCDCCFDPLDVTYCDARPCFKCRRVWYCSTICQKSDRFLHRHECQVFSTHPLSQFLDEDTFLPFFLRALLFFKSTGAVTRRYKLFNGWELAFEDLRANQEFVMREDKELIMSNLKRLEYLFDIEYGQVELRWFCQLKMNSYGVMAKGIDDKWPGLTEPVATGISLALASFDHSCVPNVFKRFVGNEVQLVAGSDIREGQKLTIAYTALSLKTDDRKQTLAKMYNIRCKCRRCRIDEFDANGYPIDYKLVNLMRAYNDDMPRFFYHTAMFVNGDVTNAMAVVDTIYPLNHPEKTELLVKLAKATANPLMVREAIRAMKVTHATAAVAKCDVDRENILGMLQILFEFGKSGGVSWFPG